MDLENDLQEMTKNNEKNLSNTNNDQSTFSDDEDQNIADIKNSGRTFTGIYNQKEYTEGLFILTKISMENGGVKYFIGKIQSIQPGTSRDIHKCEIIFMRHYRNTENKFVWPTIEDNLVIDDFFIVEVLEMPEVQRRGVSKCNFDKNEIRSLCVNKYWIYFMK
ncbi:uncharacterized protein LOC136080620 [Hydra vulgaris]|uniref:Uncharacterized protein LOC136080620 n=1 Tax=Hydra vulgaris TaxID=6087 RepID=A0ABM4BWG5_HYDVU